MREGNKYLINGELLNISKICQKYHIGFDFISQKIEEFGGDSTLLSNWLLSYKKQEVVILGISYNSIETAASRLEIDISILNNIFIQSHGSYEYVNTAVLSFLRKNIKEGNIIYRGRKFKYIKDIYKFEGVPTTIARDYPYYKKNGLTREYQIQEFKYYHLLKQKGYYNLNP